MDCVARAAKPDLAELGDTNGELGSTTISGRTRADRPPELFVADATGLADGLTMNGLE